GAVADRARRTASVGPIVRHGCPGADRHVLRGPAARLVQRGEGARCFLADPCGTVRVRVPRDYAPAWPYADRLARSSGVAVGTLHHWPRHLSRRSSLNALAHRY